MKTSLTIFILLCFASSAFADEPSVQFEHANTLYRNGEYEQAARVYEQILANGYEHASLYYNLGNCYFKIRKIPLAILNYERAKRLAPNDDDITYNLRLATLRIVDKIEPIPRLFFVEWWYSLVNIAPSDRWALITVLSLWLTVFIGAGFLLSKSSLLRRSLFFAASFTLFFCCLSVVCMIQRSAAEKRQTEAVLIAQSTAVKSAPDAQSIDLFVLHEGVKVELLDAVGEWKKIRLADGKVGWLPSSLLELI
jgi:tetratricopeptide (TPR) repeat protein